MTFRIIELTSSESVKARGYPAYLQIKTEQDIALSDSEVGIIVGRHAFHEKGVGIFSGIVNPSWSGRLTIEFSVFGEIEITKGQKVAHVVVFS